MSVFFDNDVLIHVIMVPGLSGDGFTPPEANVVRTDLDTLLSRPVITRLDDISDVDAAAPSSGQYLKFEGEKWTAANVASGVVIAEGSEVKVPTATFLDFPPGSFNVFKVNDAYAVIDLAFGGTGTSEAVARADHFHTLYSTTRVPITPQAYMSGGSRSLASTSVTLPSGRQCKVVAELSMQLRGGDPGPCYYTLKTSINGTTRSSGAGVNGYWCVQGVPDKPIWRFEQAIAGTGASIPVSAAIEWNGPGGGFYTDRGDLEIQVWVDR